jgi:aminoglycoside 6'-N-acetyltransferase
MHEAAILRPGEWSQIAIADPGTDELIGDVGLFLGPEASYAEIGFTLSRAAQGRGVATAAVRATIDMMFGYTLARQVFGITDARNTASVRVLERAGMQRVESREVVFKGEACTEWVFIKER